MDFVYRGGWGAIGWRDRTSLKSAESLTLHYTGSNRLGFSSDSFAAEERMVRSIQRYHMATRGWSDIAYNWLVGQSGRVYIGRGLGIRSAANGTNRGNDSSYAVCFLIGGDEAPSAAAVAAVQRLKKWVGVDSVKVHADWKATECPGSAITSLVQRGVFYGNDSATSLGESDTVAERVSKLQEYVGAGVDGIFGPLTAAAVDDNWLGFRDVFTDEVDEVLVNDPGFVRWVQNELNNSFDSGLVVDGLFGGLTHDAVVEHVSVGGIVTSSSVEFLLGFE